MRCAWIASWPGGEAFTWQVHPDHAGSAQTGGSQSQPDHVACIRCAEKFKAHRMVFHGRPGEKAPWRCFRTERPSVGNAVHRIENEATVDRPSFQPFAARAALRIAERLLQQHQRAGAIAGRRRARLPAETDGISAGILRRRGHIVFRRNDLERPQAEDRQQPLPHDRTLLVE